MDMAMLIKFGGAAKNKIHCSGDITILVIMPSPVAENGVLPSEEPAVTENKTVTIQPHGQRLALGTGGILKRKVLGHKIVRINHR